MRGQQEGISSDDVLYGELHRNQDLSQIDWRKVKIQLNATNLKIADAWVLEEWIGTATWMAKASVRDVPDQWLLGSFEPSFPMRHPDQESLGVIQDLDKDLAGIITGSKACSLERVPAYELDQEDTELILRCGVEGSAKDIDQLAMATSVLAVEELVGHQGEWRYSSKLAGLIYIDADQILGTVWSGPKALLS